ncbi:hypothetical protein [Fervidobacterium islandicum]|uniref:hypothetical protein n=1 Tax=Fervidobacterium islandicum TaxID=2423 RepID=UPI003A6A355F
MLKRFTFVGMLVFIVLGIALLTSCTLFGPEPLPNQPVNDSTKLEPNDPRYVADLLADDELESILDELQQVVPSSTFQAFTKSLNGFKLLEDEEFDPSEILNILEKHKTYIEKIEKFLDEGARRFYTHPDRQKYIVEIQGERKDKIVALAKKIKPEITEPDKLYMDFRDFSVAYNALSSLYHSYQSALQAEELVEAWRNVMRSSQNQFKSPIIIDEAENNLYYFLMGILIEDFDGIKEHFGKLTAIANPKDLLNMADIFVEEPFKITRVNKTLDALKWSVMSFLEIGDFENNTSIVDDKGFRKDGKETIVTLFVKAAGSEKCFVAKEALNQPVDLGGFKLNGNVPQKVKDVLVEFNKALPNAGVIEFTNDATTTFENSKGKSEYSYKVIVTLDFRKLYKDSIDLRDNNIGIRKAFVDTVFKDKQSYENFKKLFTGEREPTIDDVRLIVNNLPFIYISEDLANNPEFALKFQLNNNGNLNDPMIKIELRVKAMFTEIIPSAFKREITRYMIREKLKELIEQKK